MVGSDDAPALQTEAFAAGHRGRHGRMREDDGAHGKTRNGGNFRLPRPGGIVSRGARDEPRTEPERSQEGDPENERRVGLDASAHASRTFMAIGNDAPGRGT
jgi:hypothetical protein